MMQAMARRRDPRDEPGLFPDDRPPEPRLRGPDVERLAASLPGLLRLGTSSWTFPGWAGLVYGADRPASEARLVREGLPEYARSPLLRTVGLDRAFYRPMTAAQCRELAAQAGEGFRFLAKAHRAITHRSTEGARFLDATYARDEVILPMQHGFGASLGTILFQFPEMSLRGVEVAPFLRSLEAFLDALPVGDFAVELRDRPLLGPALAALLAARGIAVGHAIHPSLPPLAEQRRLLGDADDRVRSPAVLRWLLRREHTYEGARELYEPFDEIREPDPGSRAESVAWCLAQLDRGREVFVIANNKAEGSAPLTLLELAKAMVADLASRRG